VGAGPGRIFRQLITEGFVLAMLGTAAGLGLSQVLLTSMFAWTGAPVWLDPAPDWRVALFTVSAGIASVFLFGLTPAIQIVRQRHQQTMARQILVAAQVTASCVLLIVAGLLLRALNHAVFADPGFDYRQVIAIDPPLSAHGYKAAVSGSYFQTLEQQVRAVPGVIETAFAMTPPLGNRSNTLVEEKDGRTTTIYVNQVSAGYFRTMRIPIVRGRSLRASDQQAIVVSESLARPQWPGLDPLEQIFKVGNTSYHVVGVAASARTLALSDSDAREVYLPIDPADMRGAALLVRTAGPAGAFAHTVTAASRAADPKIVPAVQTLQTAYSNRLDSTQRSALAVTLLGITALLLACLGIVGVVAYAVSQRTKELSIRLALGAAAANILRDVTRQFVMPVAIGLLAGAGGAAVLSGFLRQELYGISQHDPLAYIAAIALFIAASAVAAAIPARRALAIDPARALRHD
jgi:predicted permease